MRDHLVVEARNDAGEVILVLEFVQTRDARFIWRALAADGVPHRQSDATFATLKECAADAQRFYMITRGRREALSRAVAPEGAA